MKSKVKLILIAFAIAIGLVVPLSGRAKAESINVSSTPVSITTQRGSTGGQPVSAMAVMDQSGTSDDPASYVSFTTPLSAYSGTHTFQLPSTVTKASVTSMKLVVNFKGPAVTKQKWSWSLYNFSTKAWTTIGANTSATSTTTWKTLEFSAANPTNYISSTGEIRISMRSSNSTDDAKIDYEAIVFSVTAPATATALPTSTLPPTATPLPPTATASPTAVPTWTATPTSIAGPVYYVSPLGNDSTAGTQAHPWRTIQKAADTVSAGSTVYVQAGTYAERVNITRSGAAGALITFQAQGTVAMNGFTINNANYIAINGFDISNASLDTTLGWGIYLKGSYNVIANNRIHDTTWGGILVFANTTSPTLSTNNLVQGNQIVHVGEVGIDLRGRNNIVAYNDISQVMQYPSWMTNPPSWADADGIHFHGSGHVLRGNYIHDILYTASENVNPHVDCFQTFYSPPSQEAATDIVIEKNRCENAQLQTTGEVGKGFMLQGASNLVIRNNLIKAYTNINANTGTSALTIINNTFTSNVALPVTSDPVGITLTDVPNSTIMNNIFYDLPGHVIYLVNSPGLTSGRNLAYRSDGRALWTTGTYARVNDLWGVNPLFVSISDFHLLPGSPAINAGVTVTTNDDFDGILRPQSAAYDIGAYEYH